MNEQGQRIPEFREGLNFIALDLETTGLDSRRDEIIEFAAIRFRDGVEAERFSTLVRPRGELPKFIQFLTHITPEDLKSAPEVKSALKDFISFVGNDVLVGHNIGFDLGFINSFAARHGLLALEGRIWDTAEISRVYLPYLNDHKLSTLVQFFSLKLENAHRAADDAAATGEVLVALSEYALKHFSLLTNARLLDLSKQAKMDNSLYDFLHRLVEYQRRYALIGRKPETPSVAKQNIIEHLNPGARSLDVKGVFNEQGLLAAKFPNFEFRSGQMEMAQEVDSSFRAGVHLVVEAGTGVGKSFAYLVPAIAFANSHQTKVVVSTNTKNLQEQLFFKDLPQLKEMIPQPFKAALVKGRENYVCERRWQELLIEQTRGISPYEAHALLHLFIWKFLTISGDVSENSSFDRNRFNIIWRRICSDRFNCLGRKCPHAGKCHVMSLRKHIETSTIVVTNHALLLADLRMENTTLGEYQYLIVDEAHNLMSTATRNLGIDLSYADLSILLNQLSSSHKRKKTGFLAQLEAAIQKSVVAQAGKDHVAMLSKNLADKIADLAKIALDLFNEASSRCSEKEQFGKLRIKQTDELPNLFSHLSSLISSWRDYLKDLQALSNVLNSINSKQVLGYEMLTDTLSSYLMRSSETEEMLLALRDPDLENYALWIENNPRSESKLPVSTLCYAPVDVSTHLNRIMYEKIPSIVFTSATLALRGSFKYFYAQSGLGLVPQDRIRDCIVDSPFDYDAQSRLMVGSFLPEHKDRFFINQALSCVEQIVTTLNVGTMILFTSYKDLNSVYDHLGDTLFHHGRPFFAQGKAISRTSMLEEFKRHKNAVLLGTNSFWEGVDVPGDSLSLLILFKLPFQVPSEPVVEALIDKLDRDNKDSFMHFMLPNALLKLRQGFGRLIRSRADRGVVLIMDSRVSNKQYGAFFKQVLPTRCLEMRSELELLSEISRFFNSEAQL